MPGEGRAVGTLAWRGPSRILIKVAHGTSRLRIALALAIPSFGCTPPPPPAVSVRVRAVSETGSPVANADVYAEKTFVTKTDRDGFATLDIRGAEGASFEVRVDCPTGYRSPVEALAVRRLGIAAASASPEYDVVCHGIRHTMVVGVRAEGGPDLPVIYLGKEIARTDRSGAAHVTVAMDVHERIELMIGTGGKENEKIHPQNPVSVFEMPDHDDIQMFPVTFTREAKRAPPRAAGRQIKVF